MPRLDQLIADLGLATRSRARDLILRGLVQVDGAVAVKPSQYAPEGAHIAIDKSVASDVSRGAEKLRGGLDRFGFDPAGLVCIDVGASTGGFTQVLLDSGARKVYAVEIGVGQLAPELAAEPRVVALEQTDARLLNREIVPDPAGALVADVSFVSIAKVLGPALALAAPGAWAVVLVKPQFEVGPELVGKGGIVRDPQVQQAAVQSVQDWFADQPGWRVVGDMPSPIAGGDGNHEFLLGAVRED